VIFSYIPLPRLHPLPLAGNSTSDASRQRMIGQGIDSNALLAGYRRIPAASLNSSTAFTEPADRAQTTCGNVDNGITHPHFPRVGKSPV
jgi:hypothetical protein